MTSPFGIEFGVGADSLETVRIMEGGMSEVKPPKPHPLFDTYIVQSTPELGVVWVKGISPVIENDNFGSATRKYVDRLAEQLSLKYGRSQKTDLLLQGSIWTEPQDWMNALGSHEQLYNYLWDKRGPSGLPDDMESIFAAATPFPGAQALVVVEYASSKYPLAQAELERLMANLL